MDLDALLAHLRRALASITHPQFYADERSFQGELLVALRQALPPEFLPDEAIIQQEYQKTLKQHGLAIRPDIIIHEPFNEARHASRRDGNHAVIALKRRATGREASEDFESLIRMLDVLAYPFGIFINVDATRTHAGLVPEAGRERIACVAVKLREGVAQIVEERA